MANRPFEMLDLPPEVRNEIYTLLLPDDREIKLERNDRRIRCSDRQTQMNHLLRLAQTCQQIHKEVVPMAYGGVKFTFYTARPAGWLLEIGSMKQHIRHVAMKCIWQPSEMRLAFHLLKQATFIQTLELGLDARLKTAKHVAQVLKPFIQVLQKSRARKGGTQDDVLMTIRHVAIPERFPSLARYARDFVAEVRAELKKLLA